MPKSMQELHLDVIERCSFNQFDAVRVVRDLRSHRHLWRSVFMCCDSPGLVLRDLPDDVMQMDTMFLLTDETRVHKLEDLVREWEPDELDQRHSPDLGCYPPPPGVVVLRAWWD